MFAGLAIYVGGKGLAEQKDMNRDPFTNGDDRSSSMAQYRNHNTTNTQARLFSESGSRDSGASTDLWRRGGVN
jgi:hypothetical protein